MSMPYRNYPKPNINANLSKQREKKTKTTPTRPILKTISSDNYSDFS